MDEPEEGRGRGWWKAAALGVGAVVAAAIAWGWASPVEEPEEAEPEPRLPEPRLPEPRSLEDQGLATGLIVSTDEPPWIKGRIVWTVALVVLVVVALALLRTLSEVVTWIVLALFFSFALEPAVNFMSARWGWRRGLATILLLGLVLVALVLVGLVFVSAVVQGLAQIVELLPAWAASLSDWLSSTFGIEIATEGVGEASEDALQTLVSVGSSAAEVLLGFSTSLLMGAFAFFTVAMFVFYMVAEAPRFHRAVLSFFAQERQEELISIWEAAIEKTGGYFYSRLVVAGVNGALAWVVFTLLDLPGAAALALFQGFVAAFIPIVGTYVASAVPAVVAFMSQGATATVIYLIYVLIYQQVENYLIAPKLQGKTMQLHPAIAFGAALAGGALGGLLWAFLALPFAATIQASWTLWFERHEVAETAFVSPAERVMQPSAEAEGGAAGRVGGFLRRTRGWLRRGEDGGATLPEDEVLSPEEVQRPGD